MAEYIHFESRKGNAMSATTTSSDQLNAVEPEVQPEAVPNEQPFIVMGSWPQVSFPSDWTDAEKLRWIGEQMGLTDLPPLVPAAFYAGDQKVSTGFSWSNYDPSRHVLVHEDLFYYFLNQDDKIKQLSKGMRTVNKRRQKEKLHARRIERRLAQARSGRDRLRSELDEVGTYLPILERALSAAYDARDQWKQRAVRAAQRINDIQRENHPETAAMLDTPLETETEWIARDGATVVETVNADGSMESHIKD